LLHIWQKASGSAPVQEYLGNAFKANPTTAVQFLNAFESIDDAAYDAILKFARPTDILLALRSQGLLDPTNTSTSGRTAQSFAEPHAKRSQPCTPHNGSRLEQNEYEI
jgi:hypothetical protein